MKFDYKFKQDVILCDDIADIEPYHIRLPNPPKWETITNYGLEPLQQFFVRENIPKEISHLNRLPRKDIDAYIERNPHIYEFIQDQWNKRENGTWQFIKGELIYITGVHWMYLNYGIMDIGKPTFRIVDVEEFWWWEFCVVQDPRVFGGINFTRRRAGKTYKGGYILLEHATKYREHNCAVQSKNESDARKAFVKSIVKSWKGLPFYFSPEFDNKTFPQKKLEFRTPSEGGRSANKFNDTGLNSFIEAFPTTVDALDGQKWHRVLVDEAGKIIECNVVEMHETVKPSLVEDGIIVGKALYTTTVEELEKRGGKYFLELWNSSDRSKINDIGQTESGLIPYFTPSERNYKFDQWGFAIVDTPTKEQIAYRKSVKDPNPILGGREEINLTRKGYSDSRKLQQYIRKFPNSIREAFRPDINECPFDVNIIANRLDEFVFENRYISRGNFKWKDGVKDSEVVWEPAKEGRFALTYLLPQDQSNKIIWKEGKRFPANTDKFSGGADPFKYDITTANKPSQGAGMWWMYFDPMIDTADKSEYDFVTDDFFMQYLFRPATKDLYCEDMLMACIYFSCQMYPEINVTAVWDYFVARGYENFLKFEYKMVKKNGETKNVKNAQPGATNVGDKMKDRLFSATESYVITHGWRCKFPDYLKQLLEVNYNDVSPYDLFVASAYCLVGKSHIKKIAEKQTSFSSFANLRTL